MQYKIPINIENEDPIVFGLSMRQIAIIIGGLGLGYASFKSLEPYTGNAVATIPAAIFGLIGVFIAIFKYSEMTFMVFILAWIRGFVNQKERYWQQGVDSFSALEIGYIIDIKEKKEKIDFSNKMDKIKTIDEQLEKI